MWSPRCRGRRRRRGPRRPHRVGVVPLDERRVPGEPPAGDDRSGRADRDTVGDDPLHAAVLDQEPLDPGAQHDLDASFAARPVEYLHQSVALAGGDVATPDVLDTGAGQAGHVGVGGALRGHLQPEAEEPLEGLSGAFAEGADEPRSQAPLVEVHVVLEVRGGTVDDPEDRLHTGPGGGEHPRRQHRRTADLVLGLEHDDPASGVRRRDRGREAGASPSDDDDVPVIPARWRAGRRRHDVYNTGGSGPGVKTSS